jgi:predicted ATPase
MPSKRKPRAPQAVLGSPFLTRASLREDRIQKGVHPFTIPLLAHEEFKLDFTTPVTFLVGENGSGKSTLLEALAWALGFGAQGGSRDNSYAEGADGHPLGRALQLNWRQRVSDGFFLRAETFFNFATYLEEVGSFLAYGGRSLHGQSHGEAFLSLFENRIEDGMYLLDEPEAALSPARQLTFLSILYQLASMKVAQFIIATHSPILLTLPGATVLSIDEGRLREVGYRDTEHYQLTRDFLNAPERYHRHLFRSESAVDD